MIKRQIDSEVGLSPSELFRLQCDVALSLLNLSDIFHKGHLEANSKRNSTLTVPYIPTYT